MKIPALYIADELLPFIRARIAKNLYSLGMTQSEIGDYLGITQAMVSKYLSGHYKRPDEDIVPVLEGVADEVSRAIAYGSSKQDAIVLLTRRIMELFSNGALCPSYSRYAGIDEEVCYSLYWPKESRREILEALELALRKLLRMKGFGDLIPEVRSNFAYSLPAPKGKDDVAAIPGRITLVKGHPHALSPEFGASSFTSGILVELGRIRPEIRSVLNIRHGKDVEEAIEAVGLKAVRVRSGPSKGDSIIAIVYPFKERAYDVVIDEGGHGLEPGVYIFGVDPFDVLRKLELVIKNMGVV